MSVCSLEFLVLLLIASVVYPWLPCVRLRQIMLAACNAGFLSTHMVDARGWLILGLFLVSGYAVARWLQSHPRRSVLVAYLFLLVVAFLLLKRYEFLAAILPATAFLFATAIVGLSYMLFRQIHVAVDAMQGQIERLSPWTFLNYQINLFGLLAGPIQRYQQFEADWNRLEPQTADTYEIHRDYIRVFLGILKIAVVAVACLTAYERLAHRLAYASSSSRSSTWVGFLLVFYLYPAYIYFNFSGYCDIVIGGARRFGLRMPENFDGPFLSRNMIEYWTRWHRTLGLWIRDYVFTPLYMSIAANWPARAASLAFACYFVALFLTGVWHGSTWNFVIFGLLNGLGVSAAKLWENWLIKRRGRQGFSAYMKSKPIRAFAIVGTFHYVCLTIYFFPTDLARSMQILSNLVR